MLLLTGGLLLLLKHFCYFCLHYFLNNICSPTYSQIIWSCHDTIPLGALQAETTFWTVLTSCGQTVSVAPEHWHKFRQIRKQCEDSITTSHKTYLKDMFNEKDPKPFSTYIRSLRKENQGIPTLQTPSGIPAATNISKANTLVNQFTSVFTKEITETLPSLHSVHPDMPKISFGLDGIAKLLSNINHTKAAGPDKLPARLLKETRHQTAPMFTHLFSQSYQHGLLPDSWTLLQPTEHIVTRQQYF